MESPQALIAPLERGSGGLTLTLGASGFRAAASQHSEEVRPKCYQGILRCRAELAGREGHAAMESPKALIAPLERGSGGFNKSSSDDRPGPGICDSKYVEDAKAARSVRVRPSAPIQKKESPQTNV